MKFFYHRKNNNTIFETLSNDLKVLKGSLFLSTIEMESQGLRYI